MVQSWRMQLNKLYSENKFECPRAGTLTPYRNTNTPKEKNVIPAGQKPRGEVQQLPQLFQTKIPLIDNKQHAN